ncbi:MAG: HD domain-containing protein [Erysipelotrichales bacterium]|nr:HD domain-containing protein [Erysipelotrichales bacterium]MBR3693602.1 HD domain-containing protein [Erysipelotrichales bacterium]
MIIEKAKEYVKRVFESDHSGHDYFHTIRVYKMATHIAMEEQADLYLVQLAALLHDVDDIKLSKETYHNKDNARSFLKENHIEDLVIEKIIMIIEDISYRGSDSVVPRSLEGMCVQDADRLDAIGAIGIARAFAYGGNHNRVMHDPTCPPTMDMNAEEYHNHVSTTINHFYEKLFKLRGLMNTDTAKKIALQRDRYMKEYISVFMDEWDGVR